MPVFTLVYYETNRLSCQVEAPTLEEAIAKSNSRQNWEDCQEESLGTGGVEEAILDGKYVYPAEREGEAA